MKARIINLMMLMMIMFIMPACNNEEGLDIDNDDIFPEISDEFKDNSAIIKELTSVETKEDDYLTFQQKWEHGYRSHYECFNSLNELENSPYISTINELPQIDWEKQSLIIARIHCGHLFHENGCNVYKGSDKYTIEYKVIGLIASVVVHKSIAIVLNQPDINKKDINFKISIAGLDYNYK